MGFFAMRNAGIGFTLLGAIFFIIMIYIAIYHYIMGYQINYGRGQHGPVSSEDILSNLIMLGLASGVFLVAGVLCLRFHQR